MTPNEAMHLLKNTDRWYDAKELVEMALALRSYNEELPWLSATKSPPPVGEKVIIAIHDTSGDTPWDYTTAGWYTGIDDKWIVDDDFCYWVTHWIPFPNPPTRGKKK